MSEEPLATYIVEHHKTHIIFDFDGTLAYAKFPWKEWGDDVSDELRDFYAELWTQYEHRGAPLAQNEVVKRHGDRALELFRNYNSAFEARYREHVVHNQGLMQEIAQFRHDYHLFMWTSNTRELIDWVLENAAMKDWFEKIVTRDDVRFLKPSPEGFELIRDPSVPRDKYVLVGDSTHDRDAAEKAGIDFYRTDFFGLGR